MFGSILVLVVIAGYVDVPKAPDIHIGSYKKELKVHLGLDLSGGALLEYKADMSKIPSADQASALDGARDVIEKRVNAFGVSEPVVQTNTVAGSQRIIIELPGVTDVNQAIDQIGKTPLLEFREQKLPPPLTDAEKKLIADSDTKAKASAETALKRLAKGEEFATIADQMSQDPGNTDPQTGKKKGGDLEYQDPANYVPEFRNALQALKDGQYTHEPVKTQFGYHIILRVAEKKETKDKKTTTLLRARHMLFRATSEQDLRSQDTFSNTGLSGEHLKSAQVSFDPKTNEPEVNLAFNKEGTKLFSEITKRNLGKQVAIYLDNQIISAPTVQSEITNGQAVISGTFTLVEAKKLAANLNAGALPVPITLIAQQTVGASLGQSSVERSFVAGILGLMLVSLFMILYYRLPGVLAVAALLVYSLFVLAIFKLWAVTLTLAGIAGFILSIGMAVDANVLIFERFKEELRAGKQPTLALEQGFNRAWLSIRDSNISSIITCIIMAWFGTSLIRGFAITLALGILISMFSAITVSRTFLRLVFRDAFGKHHWLMGVEKQQEEHA